ncbi:MAG TPA: hypothetical protein VIK71_02445 [Flavobacteriales bacterium]|jgi:hypothetical protein
MLTAIYQSLIILITITTHLSMAAPDCSKVKHGVFVMEDDQMGNTIITRENDIQREENNQMGVTIELKVQWVNECSYRLIPYRILQNNSGVDLSEDLQLLVEILEVHKDYYLQRTTSLIYPEISISSRIYRYNKKKSFDK